MLRETRVHFALSAENLPDPSQQREVVDRFAAEAGVTAGGHIEVVSEGHAGGLLALESAVTELRSRQAQVCLVGAADSWLDPERLEAIDFAGRLHSVNYSWGFTPGEGLTAAFQRVLDPRHRVAHSYCDFNGETYRADEYGFTICRTSECFEDAGSFTAAAECWGDVGAASGVLALTLPLAAWSRGYSKGPVNLAWTSSAHAPLRAAVLLRESALGPTNVECR